MDREVWDLEQSMVFGVSDQSDRRSDTCKLYPAFFNPKSVLLRHHSPGVLDLSIPSARLLRKTHSQAHRASIHSTMTGLPPQQNPKQRPNV